MNATETVKPSDATIASTQIATATKTESSSQGRVVSKAPEGMCPSWLKKALLVAAVVASIFVLAFAIAVTAGLSGVTVLGLSGFAKTISATITTYGTLALVGLSFVGAITSLSYAILKLSSISREEAKAAIKGKVNREEEAIRKEEAMLRKNMSIGEFASIEVILAEKKPLSPTAIRVFFEFATLHIIKSYKVRSEDAPENLNKLFSKTSSCASERAAWARLVLWQDPQDASAIAVLKQTALEGDSLSNYLLGEFNYFSNIDETPSPEDYLKIAADQDLALAEELLAWIESKKPETDSVKLMNLLHSAAKKDLPAALDRLGDEYGSGLNCQQNLSYSKHYYERAVELNCPAALYKVALKHLEGKDGFDKDEKKAKTYLERAASLGDDFSKTKLEELAKTTQN